MNDETSVPVEMWNAVYRQLQPEEQVVWIAQPRQAAFVAKRLPVAFFTAFWLGLAVLATTIQALRDRDTWVLALPLILAAPWIAVPVGVLLRSRGRAKRTIYAITNRRLLLVGNHLTTTAVSFPAGAVASAQAVRTRPGWGEVKLPKTAVGTGIRHPTWRRLIGLQDADAVCRMLHALAEAG